MHQDLFGTYLIKIKLNRNPNLNRRKTELKELKIQNETLKEELNIAELRGSHAKVNPASEKVLLKLGFTYVCDCPYDCGGKLETDGKTYKLDLMNT